MPTLLDLQRVFETAILAEGVDDAASYIAAGGLAAGDCLNIYRNNFIATLTTALRLSYPAIRLLVGDAYFESAVQAFIEAEPPQSAYLNSYGAGFPDFLARFSSAAAHPYLPDVARLEWAVNSALHAVEASALDSEGFSAMAAVPPDRLVLVPHPSLALLALEWPADAIWRAVLSGDKSRLDEIDLRSGPCWLLVERAANGVEVSRLTEPEWRFTSALCGGTSFADAMQVAADADITTLLATHLAAGRFVCFRVA